MGKTTIEWTRGDDGSPGSTWNPVTGCTKVSQGCKNCYAERIFSRPYPGRAFTDVRCHEDRITQPLKWTKGRRIFVNSMSDLFHEDVPFEFIDKVFSVMACTTRHTYQVLTKRPERMLEYFTRYLRDEVTGIPYDEGCSVDREHFHPKQVDPLKVWPQWIPYREGKRGGYDNCGPGWPLSNVWLGVSVEDQATADERIPLLLQIPDGMYSDGTANRWIRFLSCEPLLGRIDLAITPPPAGVIPMNGATVYDISGCLPRWQEQPMRAKLRNGIDWVIAGGESGPRARSSHPGWFRSLRDQCATAGVPYFFKQWGEWGPYDRGAVDTKELATCGALDTPMQRFGKKLAGRTLDGRTHDEYPVAPI